MYQLNVPPVVEDPTLLKLIPMPRRVSKSSLLAHDSHVGPVHVGLTHQGLFY